MTVVGAATTTVNAQPKVFPQRPHPGGEALGIVAFEVVELHQFSGAHGGGVGFELQQAPGHEFWGVLKCAPGDGMMDAAGRAKQR